jgi:ABC-type sugar transport system ATPase subunit
LASTAISPPALETDRLSKSFGGIAVLRGVSITVQPGEAHALLGQNGAGKSTLIKCCTGALAPDGGAIRVGGVPVAFAGPAEAAHAGLRVIHQERSLVPYFDVVENVFLGRRYPRAGVGLGWAAMRRTVAAIAAELAPDLPLDIPVTRLSAGQQQMAEIFRVFLGRAKIVVFDEPTTALGEGETKRLFAAIARLKREGAAVLYVSHRLDEVLSLCDRATILRDGEVVASDFCHALDKTRLIGLMSGNQAPPTSTPRPVARHELLRVQPDDITVAHGEIVGLYGLLGAGRSRLLQRLFGAVPAGPLRATLNGKHYVPKTPRDAIRHGVVLVPEDRAAQGIFLRQSVRTNVTLPLLRRFRLSPFPLPSRRREQTFADSMRQKVAARFADTRQIVARLSGGNQQKLLLGRWLAQPNALYLLDEPTKGIDVAAKADLHALIRRLAADGAGILMATSDIEELMSLSDKIVVMRDGRAVATFAPGATTQAAILAASFGA